MYEGRKSASSRVRLFLNGRLSAAYIVHLYIVHLYIVHPSYILRTSYICTSYIGLAVVLGVIRLFLQFPEESLHGLFAVRGVLLSCESGLVGTDLHQVFRTS